MTEHDDHGLNSSDSEPLGAPDSAPLSSSSRPPSPDYASSEGFPAIIFPKTWRSEFEGLLFFGISIVAGVVLSVMFPATIVEGPLFSLFGYQINLALPLLWLIPATWLSLLAFRVYNVRYSADERGLEAIEGILSFSQTITRLRYEDVRSLEMDQTILERLLNVGELEVGTAGTAGIEMCLSGVANPYAIKALIQARREVRENREEIMPHSESPTP